jgi:hypothetical protein
MSNLFEIATRKQYRFNSQVGALSVEDLWNLPLTSTRSASLDAIAKELHSQLKEETISFVTPSVSDNTVVQQKFDIVKYIIDVKVAERDAAKLASDNAAKKQKILSLIAQKQDEQLSGSSLEELQALANSL